MGKIAEKITLRSQRGYIGNRRVLFPRVRSVTQRIMEAFEHGRNGYLHNFAASYLDQLSTGTTPVTAVTDPVGFVADTRLGLQASTKGAYLSGVSGTYLTSPDSVAASITGDIDIDCLAYLTDWTPAALTAFAGHWLSTTDQRGFFFGVQATTGLLLLSWTTNGLAGTQVTVLSTVAPTVTDGAALYVRATLDVDNGAAGKTVKFYTSSDGEIWTQLGATVTTAGTTSVFDSTHNITIGGLDNGNTVLNGKVYSARIYNGIRESGGTLAVNFAGTDYVTGSTLTSSTTGEVWTLNGAAYIAPDGNHAIQATAAARPTWQVDATGHYYLSFLGTDDSLTSATGGGGSAGFFWCGVVQPTGGAGTLQTIFADNGANTGYKVQKDVNNKLSFSAGNGAAFTTLASTAALSVGTKYLLTVRDNGTNLSVQIGSAAAETVARPVVTAGTAGFTIGKDNGAASSYLIANKYPAVYWKDTGGTDAEVADAQAYARMMGGL